MLFRYLLLLAVLSSTQLLAQAPRIRLTELATGLNRPTDMVAISSSEFLISQTDGQIRIVRNGVKLVTPYLDLGAKIHDATWEGIFGITLHPNYASNGYIYVNYCRKGDRSAVYARFTRSATNPDQADSSTEFTLLVVPYPNPQGAHRSGCLGFGPDGYLYITTGDSWPGLRGSVGDPDRFAQSLQTPYGKIFRIDVDHGTPYAIPATNPYSSPSDGVADEIYALGLRNPWRWSFDRLTGDMWIGDVGQDGWEELNFTPSNATAPQNYGWPCYEGTHAYNSNCSGSDTYHMPLLDYSGYNYGSGASITGGYVYRGTVYPKLYGWYVFGDYQRGTYWSLKRADDGTFQQITQLSLPTVLPVSFGQDPNGELYVLSFAEGKLYRIIERTIASVKTGNWASPDTWNCNCLPIAGDDVVISADHSVDLNQLVQVRSLDLKGKLAYSPSGKVKFDP
ncbi:PQQ-dependent sugar dehydrogenase [Spirosoma aerolatum]|uniref:PQQ-dependent sugar dehydrogenase n=1 Tax=Spirosoma aerolatum TaxID=1211326 RepID=UPI0009AE4576|nr:PQQ-dependent sugar dehydrogenase [Spirosoma aerolatum]